MLKDEFLIIEEEKRNSDLNAAVLCRHCGKPEYYGEMRWLNSKHECRDCYRHHYEEVYGERYKWDDLDGPRPTGILIEEKADV
jgi:hypothetical protein